MQLLQLLRGSTICSFARDTESIPLAFLSLAFAHYSICQMSVHLRDFFSLLLQHSSFRMGACSVGDGAYSDPIIVGKVSPDSLGINESQGML